MRCVQLLYSSSYCPLRHVRKSHRGASGTGRGRRNRQHDGHNGVSAEIIKKYIIQSVSSNRQFFTSPNRRSTCISGSASRGSWPRVFMRLGAPPSKWILAISSSCTFSSSSARSCCLACCFLGDSCESAAQKANSAAGRPRAGRPRYSSEVFGCSTLFSPPSTSTVSSEIRSSPNLPVQLVNLFITVFKCIVFVIFTNRLQFHVLNVQSSIIQLYSNM